MRERGSFHKTALPLFTCRDQSPADGERHSRCSRWSCCQYCWCCGCWGAWSCCRWHIVGPNNRSTPTLTTRSCEKSSQVKSNQCLSYACEYISQNFGWLISWSVGQIRFNSCYAHTNMYIHKHLHTHINSVPLKYSKAPSWRSCWQAWSACTGCVTCMQQLFIRIISINSTTIKGTTTAAAAAATIRLIVLGRNMSWAGVWNESGNNF